ncbi:hypothetical protein HMN09_00556400 [Mycena chlorophos]|uniref:Uncharacterized protein n=1 Tax=Mycena chlorophos TaxID=658473 RepID=A0A8H6WCU1_MYCCL|nr:hypothetical protein HMN09_00556400 [Mycena chlorophos]
MNDTAYSDSSFQRRPKSKVPNPPTQSYSGRRMQGQDTQHPDASASASPTRDRRPLVTAQLVNIPRIHPYRRVPPQAQLHKARPSSQNTLAANIDIDYKPHQSGHRRHWSAQETAYLDEARLEQSPPATSPDATGPLVVDQVQKEANRDELEVPHDNEMDLVGTSIVIRERSELGGTNAKETNDRVADKLERSTPASDAELVDAANSDEKAQVDVVDCGSQLLAEKLAGCQPHDPFPAKTGIPQDDASVVEPSDIDWIDFHIYVVTTQCPPSLSASVFALIATPKKTRRSKRTDAVDSGSKREEQVVRCKILGWTAETETETGGRTAVSFATPVCMVSPSPSQVPISGFVGREKFERYEDSLWEV